MFVYNETTRLINMGAKLPLLPGENELTPEQARYLLTFEKELAVYTQGKHPWLIISEERILQEESDNTVSDKAAAALKAFVEEGGDKVVDATDGVPEEEGSNDLSGLAAKIAARTNAGK